MKNIIFVTLILFIISCSKEDTIQNIEINYHVWSPDTLVVDSIQIDLDNDSINDIEFKVIKSLSGSSPSGGSYYNYYARCMSANTDVSISLGIEVDPSQWEWDCLEYNNSISNNLTWKNSFNLNAYVVFAGLVGLWDINTGAGYIGIKIESNGVSHFGWIRLSVSANSLLDKRYEIRCFEYAISETDNAIIKAGQIE